MGELLMRHVEGPSDSLILLCEKAESSTSSKLHCKPMGKLDFWLSILPITLVHGSIG